MDLCNPESISPLPGHKQCLDVEKSDSSNESQGKVSEEEVSSKLLFYTFVPVLKTLPIKITLTEAVKTGLLTGKPNKNLGVPKQKVTEHTMSDGGLFKAEVIYISDCEKRGAGDMVQQETYTRPHKIKLSYKALAAIPTNIVLLDQQAIDDQVHKEGDSQDPVDRHKKEDTHAEMCSPAQLRKQSEDLYAVIDEVLEDPIPMRQASPALAYSRESMDKCAPKRYTSLPRSLGRETKYATFNLQRSVERKLADTYKTKPGVIRPANIIPRLPEENYDEAFHPNPFKQYLDELTVNDQNKSTHPFVTIHENEALMSKKLDNTLLGKMRADGSISSGNLALNTEKNSENNSTTEEEDNIIISSLLITESEEPKANPAKDGSWQGGATSFNLTKVKMEAFETHI
ncbi:uncharacterized protein mlip isoform X5 [Oncorhynchus kisutch]|uniref:uncharacterized protein mlip isoform X5 n=1 Tax=Oncorhynchus kisutch TaxID=8019 RepID=UPI0009A074A8|nr:uncharacterized protein LOC109870091 isoform X5 [Oncorhynchus kisutch]